MVYGTWSNYNGETCFLSSQLACPGPSGYPGLLYLQVSGTCPGPLIQVGHPIHISCLVDCYGLWLSSWTRLGPTHQEKKYVSNLFPLWNVIRKFGTKFPFQKPSYKVGISWQVSVDFLDHKERCRNLYESYCFQLRNFHAKLVFHCNFYRFPWRQGNVQKSSGTLGVSSQETFMQYQCFITSLRDFLGHKNVTESHISRIPYFRLENFHAIEDPMEGYTIIYVVVFSLHYYLNE